MGRQSYGSPISRVWDLVYFLFPKEAIAVRTLWHALARRRWTGKLRCVHELSRSRSRRTAGSASSSTGPMPPVSSSLKFTKLFPVSYQDGQTSLYMVEIYIPGFLWNGLSISQY